MAILENTPDAGMASTLIGDSVELAGTKIPAAPTFGEAASVIKEAMSQYPKQAAQILTSLGAVKKASSATYESYCDLCDELSITPVTEDVWAEKDTKTVFKPLVVASLRANLPGIDLTDADVGQLLEATEMAKSKREAAGNIVRILMKVMLKAPDETVASWAGLAKAAASII